MLEWIEYQGRRILRMDLGNVTIEQYVKTVRDGADMVVASRPAPNSALILACGVQPSGNLDQAKEVWKEFQEKVHGLSKAQAVVGLTGFKRVVARLVMRDLYFATSEDDAKDWLAKQ